MAYNEFAYFYDEFNGEADYEALYAHIKKELEAHGIHDGILADLGCGTGELTLMPPRPTMPTLTATATVSKKKLMRTCAQRSPTCLKPP